ncbi:MAG: sulfur transferase domain-containing protein [Steroidobacteraceae bacterium]|nr:sulfur transferase domain-containing protein [Steroidobacteraceae bacterium]
MKLIAPVVLAAALAGGGCATTAEPVALSAISDAVSPAPGIVSAGRLEPADIARVRDAGIRHVIDLTPDAETPGFDEAAAVRAAGLAYSNLPLRGAADLTRENVIAFDALVRAAKRPVLVHCASGNRVGAMAALRAAWVEGKPADEAIDIGKTWGLKGLEAEVRRRIEFGTPQSGT